MSLILGILVGLVLGLTGAGGSILALPLLMGGLGWSLTQAAPVALLGVAVSSALGTMMAWHHSYVRYRAALLMAAAGLVVAPLGLYASTRLSVPLLTMLFAGVLGLVAVRMFLQALAHPEEAAVVRAGVHGEGAAASGPICRLNPRTGRIIWEPVSFAVISVIGAVTGFLSGLLGVGGGFVIVPSLRKVTPLSMHSSVATSLMAISFISLGTAAMSAAQGREWPWLIALPFVVGSLIGMGGGRWLAPRIAGPRLQQGFAVLMLFIAAGLALRTTGFI